PLRWSELHAKAFQAQIGQYFTESSCQSLGIHHSPELGRGNKKWAPTAHFPNSPMIVLVSRSMSGARVSRRAVHPCSQQKSLTRRLSCIKKDLVAGARCGLYLTEPLRVPLSRSESEDSTAK